MTSESHPVAHRYVEELRQALTGAGISPDERQEIEREIASHLAEAVARGEPLDAVLRRLGPARQLAAAYGVELLFNPRSRYQSLLPRWRVAVAVATRWVAALLIAELGVLGAATAALGAVGILFGFLGPLLPVEPTLRAGWPQVVVVVAALALAGAGALLLRVFLFTVRLWRGSRGRVTQSLEAPK